ncbi:hypothetical protein GCM10027275_06380 [Rhabdobacter roseus]|uniref:Murein DD-endopeptidase MepM/ murein hydrolase activator NlpD n=1 Tax=Rhabdobacter roseus TaxID=1655419 RepID=A0A840TMU2_9BACT|nr:peptidoglycan DD-metalloendopeptidase family protein [Rhabdobacter roseus]MBB5282533.1 murein DD-endopeptidase MepM/ murein hydrolase activator NlpD [Rhabdobacter roseus]
MNVVDLLVKYPYFAEVVAGIRRPGAYRWLDFTQQNADLDRLDLADTAAFDDYVFGKRLEGGKYLGVGGYAEHRTIYHRSAHFSTANEEPRCIHLGMDVWAQAGTPVYAPLAGQVHSFGFNDRFGDYGPTIILEHSLESYTFYTLYGHLSLSSLEGMEAGRPLQAGEAFATIGTYPENGHWPSHLHFQIITDIGTHRGDFPGVCTLSDRDRYLALCPDPNLMLQIPSGT